MINFDLDIDCKNRDDVLSRIAHVPASMKTKGEIKQHIVGVYVQNIPADPLTKLAAYDYEVAEELGYFKIDFLNNSVYNSVKNESELNALMDIDPDWTLLLNRTFCEKIAHIGKWYYLICEMKPASVEELAMFLAIIRPGKSYLQGKSWKEIEKEVWTKTDEKYVFKKSHAISFSLSLVVQMNALQRSFKSF